MEDYTVAVEARGDSEATNFEDLADALMDRVVAHHGVCGVGPQMWTVTLSVDAPDATDAFHQGTELAVRYAQEAGLPAWPVVDVRVVRGDVLEEEIATPNYPDLVSGPEVATMLGVTRQRVYQLASEHPDFPRPMYELGVGKVWIRAAVERFAAEWDRRPGRRPARRSSVTTTEITTVDLDLSPLAGEFTADYDWDAIRDAYAAALGDASGVDGLTVHRNGQVIAPVDVADEARRLDWRKVAERVDADAILAAHEHEPA